MSHPTALPSVGYFVILDCLILENWTGRLSRNVCNYDSVLRNIAEGEDPSDK